MEKIIIADIKPFAREPVIRRMKDGTLVCLFLSGGPTEPDNANVVLISRSRDDGQTWSEPETLFSHSSRACWATEIFTECENPFAVVQTYNAPTHYREICTYVSYCNDNGEKWSKPVSIQGTVNNCILRQGITLSNGEILFPLYWQEDNSVCDTVNITPVYDISGNNKWNFVCGAAISDDGGKTFSRHGFLKNDFMLWEPNAAELEPGHIIMYMRACEAGYLHFSESFDFGRTWSEPEKSGIKNPSSKVTLIKIKDSVLLINNFCSKHGFEVRKNLEIHKSTDGKNFEKICNIENGDEVWFYPHAYADNNQQILYVAYENSHEHRLCKISYSELGI